MDIEILSEINKLNQICIEDRYCRKQIRKHIKEHIGTEDQYFNQLQVVVENFCISKNITTITPEGIATEIMLSTLIVHGGPIQSIASNLALNTNINDNYLVSVDICAELLLRSSGIVFEILHTDEEKYLIIPKFKLTGILQDYITSKKYLPPMVSTPKRWKKNRNGGYLTRNESCILGSNNHHDGHQAVDVLNILQEIPLELDLKALTYEEVPNKVLDTQEKQEQFKHMCKESKIVYQELLDHGNEFYFVWKYDKRGRIYSSGYHVNIQSTKYKKSIISFKRKELIEG